MMEHRKNLSSLSDDIKLGGIASTGRTGLEFKTILANWIV